MHALWRHRSGRDPTSPMVPIYRCTSYNTPLGPCGAPSIRAELIDGQVWATVCETMRHPELVAKMIQRQHPARTDENLQEDLAKARRNVRWLENKQQELMARYTGSDDVSFPWDVAAREVKQLEKEKREWEQIIRQAEQRIQVQEYPATQLVDIQEYCQANVNLETADFDTRVGILRALHIKVIAHGQNWYAAGLLTPEEVDQIG
jgi:hypothetical protein